MKKTSQNYMEQKVELEILIKAKNDNSDVFHDKS